MYIPAHFRIDDLRDIQAAMRAAPLANLVTCNSGKILASPVPLFLDEDEGGSGVLYGHFSIANPHWKAPVEGEALAIFMGPDAYITPSWYAAKQETGKVVPTWNYVAVHAYGVAEFFTDEGRLLELVTKQTDQHESERDTPWSVSDAPETFIRKQLGGIVGMRMSIVRLEGKRKMSQNRPTEDRVRVSDGLSTSAKAIDRCAANFVPR